MGILHPSSHRPPHIHAVLDLLVTQKKHRKASAQCTVLASVKAFYFLHQVQFGGLYGGRHAADYHRNIVNDAETTDDEELRCDHGRKRRSQRVYRTFVAQSRANSKARSAARTVGCRKRRSQRVYRTFVAQPNGKARSAAHTVAPAYQPSKMLKTISRCPHARLRRKQHK
jgi:hypothetical protein